MSAATAAAPAIASTLPREAHRAIPLRVVINELGAAVADTRYGHRTIAAAVEEFFTTYEIALPAGRATAQLADEIVTEIMTDGVYDSELEQATRASATVLGGLFPGGSVQASGWIRGTRIVRGFSTHTLTGRACERCAVNPECYGAGGGIHCLDVAGCGYQFCF